MHVLETILLAASKFVDASTRFLSNEYFSRKECLYNKAPAATLEGSRKILGGTSARSGCDETEALTDFCDILEKYRRAEFCERARE